MDPRHMAFPFLPVIAIILGFGAPASGGIYPPVEIPIEEMRIDQGSLYPNVA